MEEALLQSLRQILQDFEKVFSGQGSLREAGLRSLQSPLPFRFFVHET